MKCPSCGFDSPDGAQWCDFCKQPFFKTPKPAPVPPPNPLAGLTKEQILELPPEQLLKSDAVPLPSLPPWVRPALWGLLGFWIISSAVALWVMRANYAARTQNGRSR